jgi:hypothetical protein
LQPEEIGRIWEEKFRGGGFFRRWDSGDERHAIEIDSDETVETFRLSEAGRSDSTILAFLLLGFTLATTFNEAITSNPPWLLINMSRGGRVDLRNRLFPTEYRRITKRDLTRIAELAADEYIANPDRAPGNGSIALRRFRLAASRDTAEDAIVDYVVALESLLIPTDSTEMGYRFKMNGALLLGTSLSEREQLVKTLGELYEARSRRVHRPRGKSKKSKTPVDPLPLAAEARRIAAGAIRYGIPHGWPSGPVRRCD